MDIYGRLATRALVFGPHQAAGLDAIKCWWTPTLNTFQFWVSYPFLLVGPWHGHHGSWSAVRSGLKAKSFHTTTHVVPYAPYRILKQTIDSMHMDSKWLQGTLALRSLKSNPTKEIVQCLKSALQHLWPAHKVFFLVRTSADFGLDPVVIPSGTLMALTGTGFSQALCDDVWLFD